MIPAFSDRSQVLTIPNLVSALRILLVGGLWWLLAADQAAWAAWLIILMATTDWLDGWLARKLDQVTDLGAVLDPVGDALMMASAVLGGMIRTWVPLEVGVLILVRSAMVTGWSAWVTVRIKRTIEVRRSGKVAITFLFIAVPGFYFASASTGAIRAWLLVVAWIAASVGLLVYWWSGIMYTRDGFDLVRRRGRDTPAA